MQGLKSGIAPPIGRCRISRVGIRHGGWRIDNQKRNEMTVQEKPMQDPISKEHLRLWLRLLKTTRLVEAELRERLRLQFQTTLPRFDVMSALYRAESGLKMSQLSRRLMVSNGNVTGIVDRLSEEGILIRQAVPGDKRAALVRLTQKGRKEFETQARQHEAWVSELLGGLDGATSASVAELLNTSLTLETEDNDHDV